MQPFNNSLSDRDESLVIFRDHSDSVINALYALASGCEEYDSKSLVLSCVSFVLTYLIGCGTMNEATANAAVGPLTQIWSEAVDQNALLKRDVLSILFLGLIVSARVPCTQDMRYETDFLARARCVGVPVSLH